MSCSGGYCSNQCISNVCATNVSSNGIWDYTKDGENVAGGGGNYVPYSCAANVDNPFPDDGVSDVIYDENIETLRRSINDERLRRGLGLYTFTPTPITGTDESGTDLIYGDNAGLNEAIKELKTAINQIASVISFVVTDGVRIRYSHINELKTDLNSLRSECLCYGNCATKGVCSCYGDCGCDYIRFWG